MSPDQNFYVIVGRDGTRPISRWAPAPSMEPIGIEYSTALDNSLKSGAKNIQARCELIDIRAS